MLTRRQFLKVGAGTAAGLVMAQFRLPGEASSARAAVSAFIPGGTLDPTSISKYVQPLVIPPAMPETKAPGVPSSIDYYEIAVRQFSQQILPPGLPETTVWGYGSVNHTGTFHYPAFTIEAQYKRPVRVKWINDLKDADGNFLPHLLPVDQTLHWAYPPGGIEGRDSRATFTSTPGRYTGPVPIVTHLHGGHNTEQSDGFPEAWFLPAARNIPEGFAREGTLYNYFRSKAEQAIGVNWEQGTAVFQYENGQRATTLWYHDHTLGMTRTNVYAGPAGFYLIRGGQGDLPGSVLPGPAPAPGDKPGTKYYEIPIAIQDRSFNADGSLFYPDSRAFFDGFAGPFIPDSDVPPIWNPEFFGNTIVVNGQTWPYLEVEQRRYRFRFLNGSNSRFLILKMSNDLPFWQIGADGGFLPKPVLLSQLLMGPAERTDVIVDFSQVPVGTTFILQNIGPDEPFGGGTPGVDFVSSDPDTTGQVMQFRVVKATGKDLSRPPEELKVLPGPPDGFGKVTRTRQVSLNEIVSTVFDGPVAALLGTVQEGPAGPEGVPLLWADDITENPALNSTEVWEIFNFTEDAHPIHIHEVQFAVVNRQPFAGAARPPEPGETGTKDTVTAFPGEITRVKAVFDQQGLFVWHCHIVEHEDNEMMRPYHIGPIPQALPLGLKRKVRPLYWSRVKRAP